jgi:hypothetical protein
MGNLSNRQHHHHFLSKAPKQDNPVALSSLFLCGFAEKYPTMF